MSSIAAVKIGDSVQQALNSFFGFIPGSFQTTSRRFPQTARPGRDSPRKCLARSLHTKGSMR